MPSLDVPRIRPATPADRESIAALSHQLGYPSSPAEIERRLAALAGRAEEAVWVAELEDEVVGWVHAGVYRTVESEAMVELYGLVVDEEARGTGVGAALLATVESWTRERGFDRLRVRSSVVRERAHEFYERHGFRRTKTQHVFDRRLE
ncbi:MAG: GNAT family N-acetyltransferase [Thermoanaerobaculia bacterium]